MRLSDQDIINTPAGTPFVFDVECYNNIFYVAFKSLINGGIVDFEQSPYTSFIDLDKMRWMFYKFLVIGFNSRNYDIPITTLFLTGKFTTETIHTVSNEIILNQLQIYQLEKKYNIIMPVINHIDLIEVCPLTASLKTYAGRLHCNKMQDLPYDPQSTLTYDEIQELKKYCVNDLDNTVLICNELKPQLTLRYQLTDQYGIDLRSKSDAQIAESVIGKEVAKLKGYFSKKPIIKEGTQYEYKTPSFVRFNSSYLSEKLNIIQTSKFTIDNGGSPKWPEGVGDKIKTSSGWKWGLIIKMNRSTYTVGMGGLHSTEKSVAHLSDKDTVLIDRDVESFYPRIVLNNQLMPTHLGQEFLSVYESIVNRRIEAKRAKNSIVADSLKITINGSFGKLGSKYSLLYAPDLLLQVTITGQLCLLMLIEMIESVGIPVVSGNTDGIVIKCPRVKEPELNSIIKQWEQITNFVTEETRYKATYSKDVNNYIAVKEDGTCKTKGTYSNPWNDPKQAIFRFHKNPQTTICSEAIVEYITKGIKLADTITQCTDVTKFVSVRNVKGGATKQAVYLGKVIRWYYTKNEQGYIEYKTNGNKVPKSDGAKPLMNLPVEFPSDIDYDWYIKEATNMLFDIGYYKKTKIFG